MLLEHLSSKLEAIAAQHLTRSLRVAESPTDTQQTIRGTDGAPHKHLLFCSNDYLGLASHPELARALAKGATLWSGGAGASHLISGHTAAHDKLEARLANWFAPHIPSVKVLSFSTGYMANLAVITALGDTDSEIFSDKLNHASLIDGMRLAMAKVTRYAHNNLEVLRLRLSASQAKVKLIVSDTVFSMDGDLARVPELLALAEEFDAWLVLDDAHGFGVLGANGRGTLEHFGLQSERIVLVGTLGKAAGLSGAFVAAHERIIQFLLQSARTYIFTTASIPAISYALQTSLDLIEGDTGRSRRAKLVTLQTQLHAGLSHMLSRHPWLGWKLLDSDTPIQPLIVGSNEAAMALSRALESQGLRVPGIRPPTVPVGQARLRITLSATHTTSNVDTLLHALEAQATAMLSV
nr:8-amino-7-oxononanoate synthase [uncultured Rhodoferax sp.]